MRTFIVCTILVFCSLFNNGCAVRAFKIPTPAMSPTINPGDGLIGEQFTYKFGAEIKRFDIVTFKAPVDKKQGIGENTIFVFRIIALGNEKVEIKQGKVFINDILLEEPFNKIVFENNNFPAIVVPNDEYFLLGDNRPNSWDSRFWKPSTIKKSDIYGKIIQILPEYYKEK